MATPKEPGAPTDGGEPPKTPPLKVRGRALWRAFLIISVFVFASSMLMFVVDVDDGTWSGWWTDLLVVPGFALGVVAAVVDYVWQRRR